MFNKFLDKIRSFSLPVKLGAVSVLVYLSVFVLLIIFDFIFNAFVISNLFLGILAGGFILNVISCNFVSNDFTFTLLLFVFPLVIGFLNGFIFGKFIEKVNIKYNKKVVWFSVLYCLFLYGLLGILAVFLDTEFFNYCFFD